MKVVDWGSMAATPDRTYYSVGALGADDYKYICHNNNLKNLVAGLEGRVFGVLKNGALVPPPRPLAGVFSRIMAPVKSQLCRNISPVKCLSVREFVDQAPACKRKVYQRAAQQFVEWGVRPCDWKVKTFVKFEKLLLKNKVMVPRVIQPRSPVYSVALGRYTRAIEHDLYIILGNLWGEGGTFVPTVMKGLTPEEVANEFAEGWRKFRKPVAIGLDASRFDQHVSVDALSWEHGIYERYFPGDVELQSLLKKQLRNQGVAYIEGKRVTYKTEGCRMSGDMNTGLGNCLLMCSMVWEYCRSIGLKPGTDCRLYNNGDDCVLILEQCNLSKLVGLDQWFLQLGFTMEVEEPVYELEKVVFCQAQPIQTPSGWVMVRQLNAISKDSLCLLDKNSVRAWMHAVGVGGMALAGDIPLYHALYSKYRECGRASRVAQSKLLADSGFFRAALKSRRPIGVSDSTRLSFYRAFGVTPDQQMAIEDEVTKLDPMYLRWDLLVDQFQPGVPLPGKKL